MRKMNQWIALALMATLGGCFFAYDYEPTAGTGGAGGGGVGASTSNSSGSLGGGPASQSSSGTPGTGGNSTSSSSSGSTEFVQGENTATPNCNQVLCDSRPTMEQCPGNCFGLQWARRAGNVAEEQNARSIAIHAGASPTIVAIAGSYKKASFILQPSMSPPLLPGAPGGADFTEGFVALYHVNDGAPYWAQNMTDAVSLEDLPPAANAMREAQSVAFDSTGKIIIAGFETALDGTTRHLIVQKYDPSLEPMGISPRLWSLNKLDDMPGYTDAIAVATDNDFIYVLGEADASMANIKCGFIPMNAPTKLAGGPFVAKLDAMGNCLWLHSMDAITRDGAKVTAITTSNAATNGIWITGTITKSLAIVPQPTMTVNGAPVAFAARLDPTTGQGDAAYLFMDMFNGRVEPLDIVTTPAPNARIYLVGEAFGKTEFALSFENGQTGAFLAEITPNGASNFSIASREFLSNGPAINGAKMTGVAVNGGNIYVSGVFAGELSVGVTEKLNAVANNVGAAVPFLAVFGLPTQSAPPPLLSFDAFPGGNASYTASNVALAQNGTYVALGGAWQFNLDFTTHPPLPMVSGFLSTPPSSNADAFAALFKLPQ